LSIFLPRALAKYHTGIRTYKKHSEHLADHKAGAAQAMLPDHQVFQNATPLTAYFQGDKAPASMHAAPVGGIHSKAFQFPQPSFLACRHKQNHRPLHVLWNAYEHES